MAAGAAGSTAFATALTGSAPRAAPCVPGDLQDPDQTRDLLSTSGFADVTVRDERAPMYFGRDVGDALRFLTGQFAARIGKLDDHERTRALADLRTTLAAHEDQDGVRYDSAAWLIEARRA